MSARGSPSRDTPEHARPHTDTLKIPCDLGCSYRLFRHRSGQPATTLASRGTHLPACRVDVGEEGAVTVEAVHRLQHTPLRTPRLEKFKHVPDRLFHGAQLVILFVSGRGFSGLIFADDEKLKHVPDCLLHGEEVVVFWGGVQIVYLRMMRSSKTWRIALFAGQGLEIRARS